MCGTVCHCLKNGACCLAGDALDDNFDFSDEDEGSGSEEGDEDEEGVSRLDARRKQRASGKDELQQRFKAESAALLEKYGIKASEAGDPVCRPRFFGAI